MKILTLIALLTLTACGGGSEPECLSPTHEAQPEQKTKMQFQAGCQLDLAR